MILLVSNPSHPGIRAVAVAYKRAFEKAGVEFEFLDFRETPVISVNEANATVHWKLCINKYETVVFIQPSYLNATTFNLCLRKKKDTKFVCINTEDPYSADALFRINSMFTDIYTNEKLVAEKLGAKYLPLAFDSLQQFRYSSVKDIDFGFVSTFYPERYKYLMKLNECKNKYIAGGVGPMLLNSNTMPVDISMFDNLGLLSRHKELEVYSNCKVVLNPHRKPEHTGRTFFSLGDGDKCRVLFDKAISPNPRFFDVIACGAYPLNDLERTECFKIIKKHGVNPVADASINTSGAFTLPSLEDMTVETLKKHAYFSKKKVEIIQKLSEAFKEHETYEKRAEIVLKDIC